MLEKLTNGCLKKFWVEILCTLLVVVGIALVLTSCDSYDKLPLKHFNDELISTTYIKEYGIGFSKSLKLYTIYGNYKVEGPLGKQSYPPGICISMQDINRYPIQELLDKYPDLALPEAIAAAKTQKLGNFSD